MSDCWEVVIEENAKKQLEKLDKPQRVLLLNWIEENLVGCANPFSVKGFKNLTGIEGGCRYRVGKYRILCTIESKKIVIRIFKIGIRGSVYRRR